MNSTLLYDANLRLDVEGSEWSAFLKSNNVKPIGYNGDMVPLTQQLKSHAATFSYIPAMNYFYLRRDPAYEPIASAVSAEDGTTSIRSALIVSASSSITDAVQLRGKRLAIVHRFCTTSFLAPALLIHDLGSRIDDFFSELIVVSAYEGQVDAVVDGSADATFVQESVWLKDSANAERTRVIAHRDHLPTPLFIVDRAISRQLKSDILNFLLRYKQPIDDSVLFSGFAPYGGGSVREVFRMAEAAML
ncbi:phosphate/phosphite/phosphonate ABC transporter substrate-binding protein [Streptomyces erythrochromogenes]|uniref:phosphate/phosphite/phosphonate ABC transporter substrate-binding protein n=1 Tax=Streptomyces erythrochromogenes TaxID=285574 RepID=UPI003678D392